MLKFIFYPLSILAVLIITSDALKCYVGRQYFGTLGNGGSFAEVLCPAASNFCVKRHFAIQYNEDVIEKTCDQNSQCYKVGNGCYYDPSNMAEYCCCDTDSCNGATTTTIAYHSGGKDADVTTFDAEYSSKVAIEYGQCSEAALSLLRDRIKFTIFTSHSRINARINCQI